MNHLGDYDVIVIGAGHAGIEAAHAAAMLGAKTAVFTLSLDAIGNMPCNPSIGGTAKGTLVRELDALGGVMGLAADATYLQSRMLNKGKGPAVHALRVQTDRKRYHEYMKHACGCNGNFLPCSLVCSFHAVKGACNISSYLVFTVPHSQNQPIAILIQMISDKCQKAISIFLVDQHMNY